MLRNVRLNLVQRQNRQISICTRASYRVTEREFCANLFLHFCDEWGVTLNLKRHDDDAAQQTAKEACDPLRTILRPEQNTIAFPNPAGFQFARELISHFRDSFIRPTRRS